VNASTQDAVWGNESARERDRLKLPARTARSSRHIMRPCWRGRHAIRICPIGLTPPSDPHHLTFMQPRALGHTVSDEFTVPVRRIHHRELHLPGSRACVVGQVLHRSSSSRGQALAAHAAQGNELALSENITPSQAAQELDLSVQDRAGTAIGDVSQSLVCIRRQLGLGGG